MKAKNDKQWHRIVCERDGYICRSCGKPFSSGYYFNEYGENQYVCGHHIKTKKAHPELRLETDNGICVCDLPPKKCHTKIHSGEINLQKLLK